MEKILLGLSGGVDSAVSAAWLLNRGFDVTGCFLLLKNNSDENCPEALSAKKTANLLGIDFIVGDFRESFKKNVSDYFTQEYLNGLTPNPCVMCNAAVKFAALFECAEKVGADAVATGHYAVVEYDADYGGRALKASASNNDQSYFLYRLSPALLEKIIFPLGKFKSKAEVRKYGKKLSLHNFAAPDSMEICFIPDGDYAGYIMRSGVDLPKNGYFIDSGGNIIGTHKGIINYTVGQRRGLGNFGEPMYVKNINAADNTITLCKKEERFSFSLRAKNLSWAIKTAPQGAFEAMVKVRSAARPQGALINVSENIMKVDFYEKALSPARGQSAVIYRGDTVLGGGIVF